MCHSQHISKQCHTVFRIYAVVHFPSHKNTLNNFDNFWHVKLTAHTPTIRNVIFFTLFARWRHESGVFSPLLHPLLPLSAAILVNRNFYIKPTKVHYWLYTANKNHHYQNLSVFNSVEIFCKLLPVSVTMMLLNIAHVNAFRWINSQLW